MLLDHASRIVNIKNAWSRPAIRMPHARWRVEVIHADIALSLMWVQEAQDGNATAVIAAWSDKGRLLGNYFNPLSSC